MSAEARILYVDSDRCQRRALHAELFEAGFEITDAERFDDGITLCQVTEADVILLRVDAPESVVTACQSFRSVVPYAVIVALTEDADPNQTAEILDAGADQCLGRSTCPAELIARMRAALRKSPAKASQPAPTLTVGGIRLDIGRRMVYREGVPVRLTAREFILLHHMMANAGVPISHEALMKIVWGTENARRVEYLRSLVRQLRIKLNDNECPQYLLTESWIGYRFVDPVRGQISEVHTGRAAA